MIFKEEEKTNIIEWFNPFDLEHLKAYKYLQKHGFWLDIWQIGIINKIADCWVQEKLN